MANYLAIDYGTKNIGLALADEVLRIPYPLKSVPNNPKIIETLEQVVNEHAVTKIIIGLPTHAYGNEGESAKQARALGEKLKILNLPIIFEDERFTSAMVKKMMADTHPALSELPSTLKLQRTGRRAGKKYDKDAVEASVILESYLAKIKNQKSK